jgi:hypothetical protein
MIICQDKTQNLAKFVHFKNSYLFKFYFKNIGATINMINKNFKIFHLKIPLYQKMFFWQKDHEKDNSPNAK